jgi:hypothetical protein
MAVIAAILPARVFAPEKLDDLFEETSGELLYAGSALFDRVRSDEQGSSARLSPRSTPPASPLRTSMSRRWRFTTSSVPLSRAYQPNWCDRAESSLLQPRVHTGGRKGNESAPWPEGYQTRVLDGSCIEATERRVGELRDQAAAPLPRKALAVLNPEAGLITDFFPARRARPGASATREGGWAGGGEGPS